MRRARLQSKHKLNRESTHLGKTARGREDGVSETMPEPGVYLQQRRPGGREGGAELRQRKRGPQEKSSQCGWRRDGPIEQMDRAQI